jgi:hypothetical protein
MKTCANSRESPNLGVLSAGDNYPLRENIGGDSGGSGVGQEAAQQNWEIENRESLKY